MCRGKLLVFLISFHVFEFCVALSLSDYLKIRANAIISERNSYFGANLKLEGDEIAANKCLMTAKFKEIDEGYKNTSIFWPSRNFLEAREEIERSEVFKIIKSMPKGASLHTHSSAAVSLDFLYSNLTFMPNLYICMNSSYLNFSFFETPSNNCDWKLLEDLRIHDPQIDLKIKNYHLTLPSTRNSTSGYSSALIWKKFSKMFKAFRNLIAYRPAFEKFIYQALQEVYDDKISYTEFRYPPVELYELNGTIHTSNEVVNVLKRTVDKFKQDHPDFIGVKLIFAISKTIAKNNFDYVLKKFHEMKAAFPDLIIGFDLVGEEDKAVPLLNFAEKLLELRSETSFYFHAGETNWYGHKVDENLFDAVLMNSKRIGHGLALLKHPKLMEEVKEKNIAIEISPISNQVLGYVNDMRNHPASYFFASNLTVVVTNDDPSFWKASGLSYDFYEAFMGIMSRHADLKTLKQLAINSIMYSGLNSDEQQKALNIWKESWSKFVKYIANGNNC